MTDEMEESVDEKTESRIKVENLPVEGRELTTDEAEALKGGSDPVARYHLTDAWPKK
jgi:hypothetical protein